MKSTYKNRKPKKTRKNKNNCSNPKSNSKSSNKTSNKTSKTLKKLNMAKLNKRMYGGDGDGNGSDINKHTSRDKMNEILEKLIQLKQKVKQIESMMETQNNAGQIKPEKDEVIVQITSGDSMVETGVNLKGNNPETVVNMIQ